MVKSKLIDQAARDRFTDESEVGFSVIAPAGVGKTTAIVQRIANIAFNDKQGDAAVLPRLVVVTYTKKAADEMRQRARLKLYELGADVDVLNRFNQAFFGTIHSFCLELLRKYGYILGLSPVFQLVEDADQLWLEFMRSLDEVLSFLPEHARDDFARFASLYKATQLGKTFHAFDWTLEPLKPCPKIDLSGLINFKPESKRSLNSIEEGQAKVRTWQRSLEKGDAIAPIPQFTKGGKAFQAIWQTTFQPLRDWLGEATLHLAQELALRYQQYRIQRALLTYEDMVQLAGALLEDATVSDEIKSERFSIILDEAQDTDAKQFEVLTGVASRSQSDVEKVHSVLKYIPEPGRFCMVGDPQQSIFSGRADLSGYLAVHEALCSESITEALTFEVTMRCDRDIVQLANDWFPSVLRKDEHSGSEVDYVPLEASPWAQAGEVSKVALSLGEDVTLAKNAKAADEQIAVAFAQWLQAYTPKDFGVSDWKEVAILCPRNDWLALLGAQLRELGLATQLHSKKEILGDDPVYCWLAALVKIMAEPDNMYEIVGVLRELYAFSDDAIARYTFKQRSHSAVQQGLQIMLPTEGEGELADVLNQLHELWKLVSEKPLRAGVGLIVEQTNLMDRLLALPGCTEERVEERISDILMEANRAEEQGLTLTSWSLELEQKYTLALGEKPPKDGHIQFFSCHKSKGLEWPVVILPFLFKPISSHREQYPRILKGKSGEVGVVAFDKFHSFADRVEREKRKKHFENQRLSYVSFTRAKCKLILIDDAAYFKNSTGSLADCFGVDVEGANRTHWANLKAFTVSTELPNEQAEIALTGTNEAIEVNGSDTFDWVQVACEVAQERVERVLPSSLADHSFTPTSRLEPDTQLEPTYPEVALASNGGAYGAEYGNWWHDLMERLAWEAAPNTWTNYFEQALLGCPDVERGRLEIELFLQSELVHMLAEKNLTVRAELPIFWKSAEGILYDGFIDLVLFDEDANRWYIVDYKTDKIFDKGVVELVQRYSPQIQLYVDAVQDLFEQDAVGFLYSTRLGSWACVNG